LLVAYGLPLVCRQPPLRLEGIDVPGRTGISAEPVEKASLVAANVDNVIAPVHMTPKRRDLCAIAKPAVTESPPEKPEVRHERVNEVLFARAVAPMYKYAACLSSLQLPPAEPADDSCSLVTLLSHPWPFCSSSRHRGIVRTWLDWVVKLPWGRTTGGPID
jgi:hypothetical protein